MIIKGNGSLMRCSPIGIWGYKLPIDQLAKIAMEVYIYIFLITLLSDINNRINKIGMFIESS